MDEGKLNPDNAEVLLVGSSSLLGSHCTQMLGEIALIPKASASSLGLLVDQGMLLNVQVMDVTRDTCDQLW